MSDKTSLPRDAVCHFLMERYNDGIADLTPMVEGESSQAFRFAHAGGDYVIRINATITGFQKDAYAYEHFHGDAIPIPEVVAVGHIDEAHAFCIAKKLPGVTLQDCEMTALEQLLEPTFAVWRAIGAFDITATTGFGYCDAAGTGKFASWGRYLAEVLDPDCYDWDFVAEQVDSARLDMLLARLTTLIDRCPEERALVHGDFSANNILVDSQRVTAVLDWDCAKYGDPLYDVATIYFWRSWLASMERQAQYFAERLTTLPRYHERIACYQLRIGLAEIYAAVIDQEWQMVEWLIRRCMDILKGSDDGRDV